MPNVENSLSTQFAQAFSRILANQRVDVDVPNNIGYTLLHLACNHNEHHYSNVVSALLDRRANPNVQDAVGFTPLHLAASHGHAICVTSILKARGQIDMQDNRGFTALMVAAENGQIECAEILVRAGANLEITSFEHVETALAVAAICEHTEARKILVKLLLNQGSGRGNDNMALRTSLLDATIRGDSELVTMFSNDGGAILNPLGLTL